MHGVESEVAVKVVLSAVPTAPEAAMVRGLGQVRPPVLATSAATGAGLPEVWAMVQEWRKAAEAVGAISTRRAAQAASRLWSEIADSLLDRLRAHPNVQALLPRIEIEIAAGRMSAVTGARCLMDAASL